MKIAYAGFDKSGKAASGVVEAPSIGEARDTLRRQGLFVTDFREQGQNAEGRGQNKGGRSTSALCPVPSALSAGQRLKHLAMFARQMHVLVSSGTPIVQALNAIERQTEHQGWKQVVARIRGRVEEGMPLSEAMRQQPQHFDAVCQSLMAAGESSGNLPAMLDRLATLSRKQLHLRNAVLSALVYPSLLVSLGVMVLVLMLLFVLPRFTGLFQTLDAPLPPSTRLLMWLSGALWDWWWALLIVLIGCGFGLRQWLGSDHGRRTLHTTALNLPKFGRLARSLMTARVSRMLGTLLESRVPLVEALQLTRQSAVNLHYSELLARAEDAVGRGEPISAVLGTSDLISACVQEAIRNGEASGQIGAPLVHMADFLDEENDVVIKSLTSIIEPAILIVLGLIVGSIAMSMFLPLFDLVSAAHGG
jgi:type II secretory pathway component PulF